jgi:hypothetical protein
MARSRERLRTSPRHLPEGEYNLPLTMRDPSVKPEPTKPPKRFRRFGDRITSRFSTVEFPWILPSWAPNFAGIDSINSGRTVRFKLPFIYFKEPKDDRPERIEATIRLNAEASGFGSADTFKISGANPEQIPGEPDAPLITMVVPRPLWHLVGDRERVLARAHTLPAAIRALIRAYPALETHLPSDLRRFKEIRLNDRVLKLGLLPTLLRDGDIISLNPSIEGGSTNESKQPPQASARSTSPTNPSDVAQKKKHRFRHLVPFAPILWSPKKRMLTQNQLEGIARARALQRLLMDGGIFAELNGRLKDRISEIRFVDKTRNTTRQAVRLLLYRELSTQRFLSKEEVELFKRHLRYPVPENRRLKLRDVFPKPETIFRAKWIFIRTPLSLVAWSKKTVVGLILCTMVHVETVMDLPNSSVKLIHAYLKNLGKVINALVDFWFTGGDDPVIAEAMLYATMTIALWLNRLHLSYIHIKWIYAYSTPRGLHRYPDMKAEVYAALIIYLHEHDTETITEDEYKTLVEGLSSLTPEEKQAQYKALPFTEGTATIKEPIRFHLAHGAKLVRIIEKGYPHLWVIDALTGEKRFRPGIGRGYVFIFEYIVPHESEETTEVTATSGSRPWVNVLLAAVGIEFVRLLYAYFHPASLAGHEILQLAYLPPLYLLLPRITPAIAALLSSTAETASTTAASDIIKAAVLQEIKRHTDGIDFVTTVDVLNRRKIFPMLRDQGGLTIDNMIEQLHAGNRGYLKEAFILLEGQGWVKKDEQSRYTLTDKGHIATDQQVLDAYSKMAELYYERLSSIEKMDAFLIAAPDTEHLSLEYWVDFAQAHFGLPWKYHHTNGEQVHGEIMSQLNGFLSAPIMVTLNEKGLLDRLVEAKEPLSREDLLKAAPEFQPPELLAAFNFLQILGWLRYDASGFQLTEEGREAAKLVYSYYVPYSYAPMLSQVDELLFGDPTKVFARDAFGRERHVHRFLNGKGGAAHKNVFLKLIERAKLIFDKPIHEQPEFIQDTGSGDGTFLDLFYDAIKNRTERGKHLEKYPLGVIAADINEVSRMSTRSTLERAGIANAHVIAGDINDPVGMAEKVRKLGFDPYNGLHTNAFLTHNRRFIEPLTYPKVTKLTGAYVSLDPFYANAGYEIPNNRLEGSLDEFFRKWSPFIAKHGMFSIELHFLPPKIVAQKIGKLLGTSYNATHLYSCQYIIEATLHFWIAVKAGLKVLWRESIPSYMPRKHAAITISHLKGQAA